MSENKALENIQLNTSHISGSPENVTIDLLKNDSVRVLWEAVEDADYYTVSFSQAVGDDQEGLCRDDPHSPNVTIFNNTVNILFIEDFASNETSMLRAYITYSVTVLAFSDVWGRTVGSEAVTFTTPQTSQYQFFVCIYILNEYLQMLLWLLVLSQPQLLTPQSFQ